MGTITAAKPGIKTGNSGNAITGTFPNVFATWMARDNWGNLKDGNWLAANTGYQAQIAANRKASADIGVPLIPHDMTGQPANWGTLLDLAAAGGNVTISGTTYTTDQIYTSMGAALSDNTPVNGTLYARIWWEFNMNPAAAANLNAAKFIAAWNRAIPLIRAGFNARATAQGRTGQNIKIVFCPISDGADYAPYWPADANVDVIALDAYAGKWGTTVPSAAELLALIKTQLGTLTTFANAKGKPMALGEWGNWQTKASNTATADTHGRGDFPDYIDQVFDWAERENVEYLSYFNLADGGVGITIEDTPNSKARYLDRANAQTKTFINDTATDSDSTWSAAKIAATQGKVSARVRRQVSTRSSFPSSARIFANTSSNTQVQQTLSIVLTSDVEDLQFTWQNAHRAQPTSADMSGLSPITIRAALWDGTNTYPLFFRGSRTLSLDPAGIASSDPVLFRGYAGQRLLLVYLITWATAPAYFPGSCLVGLSAYDMNEMGTALTDRTNNFSIFYTRTVGNYNILPPIAITGTATSPGSPVVAILGDSISSDGVNDYPSGNSLDFGWIAGGLADAGIPYIQLGTSALKIVDVATSAIHRSHLFKGLVAGGVTHLFIALATNDWASNRTAAQVYADMQTIRAEARVLGIKVIVCTAQPKTNADNTAADSLAAAQRPTLNATIIANNGVGDGYYDLAAVSQSASNSALWRTDTLNPGSITIVNGGTGYAAGDQLSLPGGTSVTVNVTGSTVTAASITNPGGFAALPTGPLSALQQTTAAPSSTRPLANGTGATFTLGSWTSASPTPDGVHPAATMTRFLRAALASVAKQLFNVNGTLPAVVTPDTTAPSTPGTPTAVAGASGSGAATVTFTAATDNTAVVGYRVFGSVDGYVQVLGAGASSPITVTGLTGGTAYAFEVQAYDAANNLSAKSAPSNSVTPPAATFTSTGAPAVTPTSAVNGTVLTTSNGTYSATPDSYTYQWMRAGAAISGATASTYTVVSADLGNALTCVVTAVKAGYTSVATTSNAVTPSSTPALTNTAAPAVTGTGTVGQTLTTTNGSWSATPESYTYQWMRGAVAISGATSATYVLVSGDAGTTITCVVTAVKSGYQNGTATSNGVAVAGAASNFVNDSFTQGNNSTLVSHTGETGATWTMNTAFSAGPGNMAVASIGVAYPNGSNSSVFIASGVAPSADYSVEVDINYVTVPASSSAGVVGREASGANTGYFFRYAMASAQWQLGKYVAGTATTLVTQAAANPTAGTSRHLKLTMTGSTLTGYVDGVQVLTTTDTSITAAGFAGLMWTGSNTGDGTTTGVQFDNFVAHP